MDQDTDFDVFGFGAQVARLFGYGADRFGNAEAFYRGECPVNPYNGATLAESASYLYAGYDDTAGVFEVSTIAGAVDGSFVSYDAARSSIVRACA
jgi:hypothetical protein